MKLLSQLDERIASPRTGFNHNIKHLGRIYHVQTEDSGVDKGHLYTHLFFGGTVISTNKIQYDKSTLDESLNQRVARLMQDSHKAMILGLCRGAFDEKIKRYLGGSALALVPDEPHPPSNVDNDPIAASDASGPSCAHKQRIEKLKETIDMDNVTKSLTQISNEIAGFLGVALVDHQSGMCLGAVGTGINLEVAAAGNMEVVRAKMRVMRDLGIKGDIEDILITLGTQYHIIRLVNASLFLYLAIDRKQGNLALARHKMAAIGADVVV